MYPYNCRPIRKRRRPRAGIVLRLRRLVHRPPRLHGILFRPHEHPPRLLRPPRQRRPDLAGSRDVLSTIAGLFRQLLYVAYDDDQMAKPSVYIETTIVSYLTAWPSRDVVRLSRELLTREWSNEQRHRFDLYTSELVRRESSAGDPTAAVERLKSLEGIPLLGVSDRGLELAKRLATALSLPMRAQADAAHLAIAAVNGMSFLLTWNCRHLANGMLTDRIERGCRDAGFAPPRILTPEQLMETT